MKPKLSISPRALSRSERYIAGFMQYVILNDSNFSPLDVSEEVVLELEDGARWQSIRFLEVFLRQQGWPDLLVPRPSTLT